MRSLSGLLCGLLMATASSADVLDECRRPPRTEARLKACNEVIGGATFTKEQKATAFRHRAETRMAAGALKEAIDDFTQSLSLVPTAAPTLAGRGQAHLLAGSLELALADYSAAIQANPGSAALWLERGHVNLTRGQHDAAIGDLSEAIRLNPKSAAAHNNRGLAYRKAGRLDHAREDYTTALMLNPVYANAYANRGYLEEARGRKAEAIADLRAAITLDPSMAGASEALKRLGATDPFAEEGRQRVAAGKALVEANCARCHATGTTGDSPKAGAPQFRNLHQRHPQMALREPLTRGIAAPHDEMPQFPLTTVDIDNIVAYINSLGLRK